MMRVMTQAASAMTPQPAAPAAAPPVPLPLPVRLALNEAAPGLGPTVGESPPPPAVGEPPPDVVLAEDVPEVGNVLEVGRVVAGAGGGPLSGAVVVACEVKCKCEVTCECEVTSEVCDVFDRDLERPMTRGKLPSFVASTGKGLGTLVPRARCVSSTALTTRREVASKRGLQVVSVSSGAGVGSRTATSDGATTNWLTTR